MQSDVSTVKDRLNIVDIVGEYVRLTKTGANHKACCPFHEEKTPSFIVTEDRGTYHCFGCGKGGDAIAFIMEIEAMDFPEALKLLADRAGVELKKYTPEQKKAQDQKSRLYEAMQLSVQFYEKQLWESTSGKTARAYLEGRGLTEKTMRIFGIGYAPDGWHHAEKFLTGRKFSENELAQVGLLIQKDADKGQSGYYDRFRDRIMFPINDVLGRTIGYSARELPGAQEGGAKYINTPESPLYHKSDILYGIDLAKQAIKKENHVILVEGNMDVVAAHEANVTNIVGVSGTALTENHIKILKRYTNHFILFFDADDAGKKAAKKSAAMCLAQDVTLSLVTLTQGKDAADLVREDPDTLRAVVKSAKDAITFFIDQAMDDFDIGTPHGKRRAVEDVLSLALHVAHPIERSEWIKKVVSAYNISEDHANEVIALLEKGEKPPQKKKSEPREELEEPKVGGIQSESETIKMALSFPEAWQYLSENTGKYPFIAAQEKLEALSREGPLTDFDAGEYLEKRDAGTASQKYHALSAYREQYLRTRPDNIAAVDEMRKLLERNQHIYDKKLLSAYTQKLKDSEAIKDLAHKKKIMEKITEISRRISQM